MSHLVHRRGLFGLLPYHLLRGEETGVPFGGEVPTEQGAGPGGPRGCRADVFAPRVIINGDAGEFPPTGLVQEGAVGQRGGLRLVRLRGGGCMEDQGLLEVEGVKRREVPEFHRGFLLPLSNVSRGDDDLDLGLRGLIYHAVAPTLRGHHLPRCDNPPR